MKLETKPSLEIESWPRMFLAKKIKSLLTECSGDFKFCFVNTKRLCDVDHGANKSAQNWSEMRSN